MPRSHKGLLVGMYVRPRARGAGVGRRLVEAIIDLARRHVELIQLSVVEENEAARRLYAGLGFLDYGIELHALKQGGRYYDEILMAKDQFPMFTSAGSASACIRRPACRRRLRSIRWRHKRGAA